jgi:diacylglycerol diphosphate phosphatase / phosphatidate phosphatase
MQQHQAHDLVFGMIIGLVLGTLAYRSAYAAIFDFRYNHVPLPPFAIKVQYLQYPDRRQDKQARLEEEIGADDEELFFRSWWKQFGAKTEEKGVEMPFLQIIKCGNDQARNGVETKDAKTQSGGNDAESTMG